MAVSRAELMSLEEARSRIDYRPDTGEFFLKRHLRYPSLNGRKISSRDAAGYAQINMKPYGPVKGHRLAWLLHYGEWPKGSIDHINGVRDDNRIENLRIANNQINCQNKRKALPSNKLGVLGVSYYAGAYRANIMLNKKQIHIGRFDTIEEASRAYVDAKRKYHEGCTI